MRYFQNQQVTQGWSQLKGQGMPLTIQEGEVSSEHGKMLRRDSHIPKHLNIKM